MRLALKIFACICTTNYSAFASSAALDPDDLVSTPQKLKTSQQNSLKTAETLTHDSSGLSEFLQKIVLGDKPQEQPSPQAQHNVATPQSAPTRLEARIQSPTADTLTTPIRPTSTATAAAPATAPLPTRRHERQVYQDQISVSSGFLAPHKREYISKRAHILLSDFKDDYIFRGESVIDITGLSARARIYLLSSITNFKLNFLGDPRCWTEKTNTFTNRQKKQVTYIEHIDKRPTTFQIGRFSYKLESARTKNKTGGGRLFGLISQEGAETYLQIQDRFQMQEYRRNIVSFIQALLIQKKDGQPIYRYIKNESTKVRELLEERSRFLNGFNLLLDFEVSRRLTSGDCYGNLPVISYLKPLISRLDNELFVKHCFDNLFSGDERENTARSILTEYLDMFQTLPLIRNDLSYLHADDEDSGDDYS
ncbi:hypothetical protein [Candidatus Finniella inopinata]|uniref:Uncharacterized protein n=1 Tax=Candidatus Finniella inopinata TaxID=1696036 RepID=A0A4Q7DF18_9PROT|nr:hypothetical protein [Candidatus Finniella inopinata]RZI45232.1 hypothetical protein EQU50_07835 [Candidatus Finniella inopinata]